MYDDDVLGEELEKTEHFKRGEKPEFFTIWIDENETHRKTAKETKNDE